MKKMMAMMVLGVTVFSGSVRAANFELDQVHSNVIFKIKHLLSTVQGSFLSFSGSIQLDEKKIETSSVEATIKVDSIETHDQQRNTHLQSADFFDAAKYPTIVFKSTKVEKTGKSVGKVHGKLTIHGLTKDIVLDVEYFGTIQDPFDPKITKAAFVGTTKINRKDFGIVWNKVLDKGNLLLGEEVDITLNIEAATTVVDAHKNHKH